MIKEYKRERGGKEKEEKGVEEGLGGRREEEVLE